MLADAARRVRHGNRATYLRMAWVAVDAEDVQVPGPAREVELTGSPGSIDEALAAIRRVASVAGGRAISALSWADIERLAGGAAGARDVLLRLHDAGLDALASLPIDQPGALEAGVPALAGAGFAHVRLSVGAAAPAERVGLFIRAAELQDEYGCIAALDPLPRTIQPLRPTTGYEDVKMVAVARLAAPGIAAVQLDWRRYGPKLAQVALTFGGSDVHGISASDEAPEGRRRAPLEEIRRNIEAAGFEPVERDGRFL
jgi:aminodeoxyfutalosine synthase